MPADAMSPRPDAARAAEIGQGMGSFGARQDWKYSNSGGADVMSLSEL
jgi:hypothetical protein